MCHLNIKLGHETSFFIQLVNIVYHVANEVFNLVNRYSSDTLETKQIDNQQGWSER